MTIAHVHIVILMLKQCIVQPIATLFWETNLIQSWRALFHDFYVYIILYYREDNKAFEVVVKIILTIKLFNQAHIHDYIGLQSHTYSTCTIISKHLDFVDRQ